MISRRVRQFVSAIKAQVTEEDREFVAQWLNEREQKLFFALSIPDQCHAIRTAKTMAKLLAKEKTPCDERLAFRVALLHDIGRRKTDMGTSGKVVSVLVRSVFPKKSRSWGKRNQRRKGIRHMLYVYYEHPRIGAEMLQAIGCCKEAEIIRRHHEAPTAGEPSELRLLRIADELN